MRTYKNSTVEKLVKHGLCVACEKRLTEEDKKGRFIRCGVCRDDLQRDNAERRKNRKGDNLCPGCGKSKVKRSDGLAVSPYCHDCAFGVPEKEFDDNDPDAWIKWGVPLVKKHRRLFMRLHDPERREK